MRTKAFITIIAALSFLALAGWGCKSSVPPEAADTSDEISETSPTFLTYENGEVRFQHPSDWRLITFDDAPNRVGIVAPDNPGAEGHEPLPEISVIVRDNPMRLAIRDFYEQAQEPVFEDAIDGVSAIEINEYHGFSLQDVIGEVTVNLVILAHETHIVEFELTRDEHREVFDILISSFRFLTGGE